MTTPNHHKKGRNPSNHKDSGLSKASYWRELRIRPMIPRRRTPSRGRQGRATTPVASVARLPCARVAGRSWRCDSDATQKPTAGVSDPARKAGSSSCRLRPQACFVPLQHSTRVGGRAESLLPRLPPPCRSGYVRPARAHPSRAHRQTASGLLCSRRSARSSWPRALMLSLVKTLWRWYSTVRGLMNSRAPISEFDSPSRAICATWSS